MRGGRRVNGTAPALKHRTRHPADDRRLAEQTWRSHPKLRVESCKPGVRHAFPDPHRTISLHVRVTADWAHSCPGSSDVSAQQKEIRDLLNGRDRLRLLRKPHRPATNRRP